MSSGYYLKIHAAARDLGRWADPNDPMVPKSIYLTKQRFEFDVMNYFYPIILILGSICGMFWSLLPGFLSEIIRNFIDLFLVLFVGIITGMSMAGICLVLSRYFNYSYIKLILLSPIIISLSGLIFGGILGLVAKIDIGSEIYNRTKGDYGLDFLGYGFLWIYIFPIVLPFAIINISIFNKIYKSYDLPLD